MLGGFDSYVYILTKPQTVIHRFLEYLKHKWPTFHILVGGGRFLPEGTIPEEMPDDGDIHVVRDERMIKHFETEDMTHMEDGEGPISLWYNKEDEKTYIITLVTPGHPKKDRFSGEILEILIEACGDRLEDWGVYGCQSK